MQENQFSTEEIQKILERNKKLEGDNVRLKDTITKLKNSKNRTRKKYTILENQVTNAKNTKTRLAESNTILKSENKSFNKKTNQMEKENKLLHEIADTQKELQEKEDVIWQTQYGKQRHQLNKDPLFLHTKEVIHNKC